MRVPLSAIRKRIPQMAACPESSPAKAQLTIVGLNDLVSGLAISPHPSPLPLGEGTGRPTTQTPTTDLSRGVGRDVHVPPLPQGEERGSVVPFPAPACAPKG